MTAALFAVGSVISTLAGGLLLVSNRGWTERHLRRLLAFGSGVLLGITFLHLLPEAWQLDPRWAGGAVLAAFILLFLTEQFTVVHACAELAEECRVHKIGHGALVAMFLHSFADGLAMAFSFLTSRTLGFVVSSAILVHKFSDGVTLSSLLLGGGHSGAGVWTRTMGLALATPLGVLVGMTGAGWVTPKVLAVFLGLAAGGFLYLSTADILPRLHRSRDPLCWLFLVVGMLLSGLFPHP